MDIQKQPASQARRTFTMPAILVIALVATAGLFAYALLRDRTLGDEAELSANIDDAAANTGTTNTAVNLTDEQRQQAQLRDAQRVADIKSLNAAIASFNKDVGNYPDSLDLLKPKYLKDIPQNPVPGGATYDYTGIGSKPYSYYDLTYALEVGSDGISAGEHSASPDGIATP